MPRLWNVPEWWSTTFTYQIERHAILKVEVYWLIRANDKLKQMATRKSIRKCICFFNWYILWKVILLSNFMNSLLGFQFITLSFSRSTWNTDWPWHQTRRQWKTPENNQNRPWDLWCFFWCKGSFCKRLGSNPRLDNGYWWKNRKPYSKDLCETKPNVPHLLNSKWQH